MVHHVRPLNFVSAVQPQFSIRQHDHSLPFVLVNPRHASTKRQHLPDLSSHQSCKLTVSEEQ